MKRARLLGSERVEILPTCPCASRQSGARGWDGGEPQGSRAVLASPLQSEAVWTQLGSGAGTDATGPAGQRVPN